MLAKTPIIMKGIPNALFRSAQNGKLLKLSGVGSLREPYAMEPMRKKPIQRRDNPAPALAARMTRDISRLGTRPGAVMKKKPTRVMAQVISSLSRCNRAMGTTAAMQAPIMRKILITCVGQVGSFSVEAACSHRPYTAPGSDGIIQEVGLNGEVPGARLIAAYTVAAVPPIDIKSIITLVAASSRESLLGC